MTHGLGAHWLAMLPLGGRLKGMGYEVVNWGYRSLSRDVAWHARALQQVLSRIDAHQAVSRFHIVAHSMGSILTRVALQDYHPAKLHRIVMLCPPNRGSHVATRCAPWLGWLSTTLQEITDRSDSFVNQIPDGMDPRYEVGIVRARKDFVVRAESTRLSQAKEYVDLPGFHSSVIFRRQTADEVERFLRTGSFLRPNERSLTRK